VRVSVAERVLPPAILVRSFWRDWSRLATYDGRIIIIIIIITITPWCRVLLEKLTGLRLVKKFPTFDGTRNFITALTTVR